MEAVAADKRAGHCARASFVLAITLWRTEPSRSIVGLAVSLTSSDRRKTPLLSILAIPPWPPQTWVCNGLETGKTDSYTRLIARTNGARLPVPIRPDAIMSIQRPIKPIRLTDTPFGELDTLNPLSGSDVKAIYRVDTLSLVGIARSMGAMRSTQSRRRGRHRSRGSSR